MKEQGTNPLKILIALAALLALTILGSSSLYRQPGAAPSPELYADWLAAAGLTALLLAWTMFRAWRREPRRRWQPFQLLSLLAIAAFAVQRTGGLHSFLLGLYGLLTVAAVYRGTKVWSLTVPLSAIMVEGLSSLFGQRLPGELAPLASLSLLLVLSWCLGLVLMRQKLQGRASERLDYDEPEQGSQDLHSDLQSLVDLIHACIQARTTALFLADERGAYIELTACKSYSPEVATGATLEVARSFLGWVVRERQGLLYPSFDKETSSLGYYQGPEKVAAILAVPIMDERRAKGIIVVDSDRPQQFDDNTKLLLQGFAQSASRLISLNLKHTALGLEHERLREWNHRLEMMASRLKVADVVKIMQELVPALVPCDHLVLLELLPEPNRARVLLSDPPRAGHPAAGAEIDISGSLAEQALSLREWRLVDDFYRRDITVGRFTADEGQDHGFRSVLVGPLLYEDDCHYLLALESRKPNAYEASLDTIHIVANQFSLALKSASMYEEKEALAIRDGLTGLWNHRHFQEYLSELLSAERAEPVGLALFDIDHFKKLNDTYGHPIGDVVLKEVAARLRRHSSQFDLVARYGGEEFVAIWPGSDARQAERLGQGIREAIGDRPFATPAGELAVTVSIGVAAYPADARTKDELIKMADKALYAAKRGGRDRVVLFKNLGPDDVGEEAGCA